jgi:hypothetical protein
MRSAALADEPQGDYELVLTPPARRALTERLPEAIATAVINFLTTSLVREPRRVGKPLRGDLAGIWSARRAATECSTDCATTRARSSSCASSTAETPTVRSDGSETLVTSLISLPASNLLQTCTTRRSAGLQLG